nr:hypothetical protein [Acidobacteriota bacterium]
AAVRAARSVFFVLLATLALASAAPGFWAHAAGEPARPGPSPAELDREIARLTDELSRAGSEAQQGRIEERLAQLWLMRARGFVGLHEATRAADAYEKALDLAPELLPALVELGFLELRAGDPDRALLLADQGLLAHPGDGWLHELRGEALYRDGRLADAWPEYEAALASASWRPKGATTAR